jgi:hypothetical protein
MLLLAIGARVHQRCPGAKGATGSLITSEPVALLAPAASLLARTCRISAKSDAAGSKSATGTDRNRQYGCRPAARLMYHCVSKRRETAYAPAPSPSPCSSLADADSCIGYRNPTASMAAAARLRYHSVPESRVPSAPSPLPLPCSRHSTAPPSVREAFISSSFSSFTTPTPSIFLPP